MPKGLLYTHECYQPLYEMNIQSEGSEEVVGGQEPLSEEEFLEEDHEMEDEEREPPPRTMKRERAFVETEDTFVDLAQFFGSIPHAQQISICRAYGSYLAAVDRARDIKRPRTYHKTGLFKKTK